MPWLPLILAAALFGAPAPRAPAQTRPASDRKVTWVFEENERVYRDDFLIYGPCDHDFSVSMEPPAKWVTLIEYRQSFEPELIKLLEDL